MPYTTDEDDAILFEPNWDTVFHLIRKSIGSKGAHFDVACVIQALWTNKDGLMIQYTTKQIWYVYQAKHHKWVLSTEGLIIRISISTFAYDAYAKYCKEVLEPQKVNMDNDDDDSKKRIDEQIKTATEIMLKLKSCGYKDSILKEFRALCCNEKFTELLDSKRNIIHFTNGVYDFATNEFRAGTPNDYCSLSTRQKYIRWEEQDATMKEELITFLQQAFPDPVKYKYVVGLLAITLASIKRAEEFYLLNGSGSNSKSKLLELLQQAIGEYYGLVSCAFLTQKRASSNSSQEEVIKMKGKRFVILQEPSEGEVINTGVMKEFTGGDRIQARGLYKEPIEFMPFYRMYMITNNLPEVKSDDGGTWRRIKSIEFTSKFVDKEDYCEGIPNLFLRDTSLADKFPKWSSTFVSYLIHLWIEVKDNHTIPDCVKDATKIYQLQNDPIQSFLEEKIEITEDEQASPLCDSIFITFKMWCHQQNISTRFVKATFLTKLHTKLKKRIGDLYPDPTMIQKYLFYAKSKPLTDEDDYDALTPQEKMKIDFDNWFSKTYDTIQGTNTKWEDIIQHFYDSHTQYKIETKRYIENALTPILQRRNMFKVCESHKVKGKVVSRSVITNCGLYLC